MYEDGTYTWENENEIDATTNENMVEVLDSELDKLEEEGILKYYDRLGPQDRVKGYSVGTKSFPEDDVQLDLFFSDDVPGEQQYYQMDHKTRKLLLIEFTDDHRVENGTKFAPMGHDKKLLMERYISYLGLDILDDWVYHNDGSMEYYTSESAQLNVYALRFEFTYSLKVQPFGNISPNEVLGLW